MKLENFKVLQNLKNLSLNKKYNRINIISMEFSRQKYCSRLPFPSPFTYACVCVCVCVCVCKNAICDHPLELVGMCVCTHFMQSIAKNQKWDALKHKCITSLRVWNISTYEFPTKISQSSLENRSWHCYRCYVFSRSLTHKKPKRKNKWWLPEQRKMER